MPSQQEQFLPYTTDAHGPEIEPQVHNHRSSAPPHQRTPPVSFYNPQNLSLRYVPGTRMINIPPPQNYPTVDGIARPPSPYITREASMPMPPLTGFGEPFGRPMIGRKCLQSILEDRAAVSRSHRRNTITVSSSPEVTLQQTMRSSAAINEGFNKQTSVSALAPEPVEERISDHEKSMFSKFDPGFFKSIGSGDNCEPTILESLTSHSDDLHAFHARASSFSHTLMQHQASGCGSPPYDKEEITTVVSTRTHDRNSSTNSGLTVASDSWNTMNSSKVPEDKPLMDCAQTTSNQKTYLLDQHMQGSSEHEVKVYDFAHISEPAKTVRFSSHPDDVPLMRHRSASNSSESSSRILIDLGEYKESQGGGNAAQSNDRAVASKGDDASLLRATTYHSLSADSHEFNDASDDDESFTNASRKRLIPSKNRERTHQIPKKSNPSGPLEILNRASVSISNVAAAHAGMTPPRFYKTGVMNRDFRFPARDAEQRFSSIPNLRSGVTKTAETSRHSRSFSRLFEGFGSKKKGGKELGGASEEIEVTGEEKSRASLARHISKRISGFVVRKGW